MVKTNTGGGNTNFFYCLTAVDGLNTEYLRVKEINQAADYPGVSLELRFFTSPGPHHFRFYIKAGAEVNYLLHSKVDVVFKDAAMDPYQDELAAKVKEPQKFSCFSNGKEVVS